jgi:hypothetical protein
MVLMAAKSKIEKDLERLHGQIKDRKKSLEECGTKADKLSASIWAVIRSRENTRSRKKNE